MLSVHWVLFSALKLFVRQHEPHLATTKTWVIPNGSLLWDAEQNGVTPDTKASVTSFCGRCQTADVFTWRMPIMMLNQQCQSTEVKIDKQETSTWKFLKHRRLEMDLKFWNSHFKWPFDDTAWGHSNLQQHGDEWRVQIATAGRRHGHTKWPLHVYQLKVSHTQPTTHIQIALMLCNSSHFSKIHQTTHINSGICCMCCMVAQR